VTGKNAVWKGIAGYGKLAVTDNFSLALRGETFKDEGGTRLGTDLNTTASEITVTPSYKVSKNFIVRAEGRYDNVNQDDVFTDNKGLTKRNQTTIGLNAIFVF
jgi:predicted porin